ncbi:histidine--tRNA ligase [bacterium]|jgi:histidyl-tRNA synthetase|nr:histidine--tRNA ligase [bacterium]|tara:strand:+ start:4404 stop:5648 length:1245 start_codon:yes stop_codon:yes gene_type:complete
MKLSTDSYKGVRDFYPRDKFVHDYILNTWAHTCESVGYEPYAASILEPAELYKSKTSDEIVNEQTYTFEDRGGREVTLRPEMTPTVARMVARQQRELGFPLRWYSTPNCFRYERMQRGRLREFWQLNADLFGLSGIEADTEIIMLAHSLMKTFGATDADFEIRLNDRRVFDHIFDEADIDAGTRKSVISLLDRRTKIDNFESELAALTGDKATILLNLFNSAASNVLLEDVRESLIKRGVENVVIDTSITRGFDYYTGMIFEVFDTAPENNRSLFGGGRYDNLLEVFGVEKVSAVGFGMGDVTIKDFLETHDLLPEYVSPTDIMLCVLDESASSFADSVAQTLREQDMNVAVNYSYKKAGNQIKMADKKSIPFVACIGKQEMESNLLTVKHLSSGEQKELPVEAVADHIFTQEI